MAVFLIQSGLAGIDYDQRGLALGALADLLPDYPHRFARLPNRGRATGRDLDGDGDPDLAVTNFDVETNTFYENRTEAGETFLQFADVSARNGFGVPSFNLLGFGLLWPTVLLFEGWGMPEFTANELVIALASGFVGIAVADTWYLRALPHVGYWNTPPDEANAEETSNLGVLLARTMIAAAKDRTRGERETRTTVAPAGRARTASRSSRVRPTWITTRAAPGRRSSGTPRNSIPPPRPRPGPGPGAARRRPPSRRRGGRSARRWSPRRGRSS